MSMLTKRFAIAELFPILMNGRGNNNILSEGNDCPYVGAKKSDNGVMRYCAYNPDLVQQGNCILFICNGAGSVGYTLYMDRPFISTSDVVAGYAPFLNREIAMYLITLLDLERPKYSYGRKWKRYLRTTTIPLPIDSNGNPNWDYIQSFISTLIPTLPKRSKAIWMNGVMSGSIVSSNVVINTDRWKWFALQDIFHISYGNSFELINLSSCDKNDNDAIAFVSRSSSSNGVDEYVERVLDVEPFQAGDITVALGGSVLSTFIQPRPFYTAYHIKVLTAKKKISILQKIFVVTLIRREAYRYSYGRQANTTLDTLQIKLPIKDEKIVWTWIQKYMESLPFSKQLNEGC